MGKMVEWAEQGQRMVCTSLELAQVPPLNSLPSHRITLTLSNNKISKVKNDSFSRLTLLERPPWSTLLLETMLYDLCGRHRLY